MVLLALGLIDMLAYLMTPRLNQTHSVRQQGRGNEPVASVDAVAVFVPLLFTCSALATISAQFLGAGLEQELVAAAPIDQIPHHIGKWKGTDLAVPDEIAEMLTPDMFTRRVYSDLGFDVYVWVI